MVYRETEEPTLDEMISRIEKLEDTEEKLRKEIKRVKKNNLYKFSKFLCVGLILLIGSFAFYDWAGSKRDKAATERHAAEYHESMVQRHRQAGREKERKKFLKQREQIFESAGKWIEKHTEGSPDPWCYIPDQQDFDPSIYYTCTLRFENYPPVNLDCSMDRCYRKFE